jgi:hypothetical protein
MTRLVLSDAAREDLMRIKLFSENRLALTLSLSPKERGSSLAALERVPGQ